MIMTADLSPLDSRRTGRALDVATRLFGEHGVSRVDMTVIAREAGIDALTLRRAFPTKVDLVHAIALRTTRALVAGRLVDDSGTPVERLSRLVRAHVGFCWRHRTEEELRRSLTPALRAVYPARHREISDLLRAYREHIDALISAGRAQGLFVPRRPGVSAGTVLEMLDGALNWYDPSDGLSVTQLGDVYVDLIIHHLLGAPRD
ncbi:hypothetical protein GCM10027294_02800 [Marinactinospora endophytica]